MTVRAAILRELLDRLRALPGVDLVVSDGEDETGIPAAVKPGRYALEVMSEGETVEDQSVPTLLRCTLRVSVVAHFSRERQAGETAQDVASALCAAVYGVYGTGVTLGQFVTEPWGGGAPVAHALETTAEEFGEDVFHTPLGTLGTMQTFLVRFRMRRENPAVPA